MIKSQRKLTLNEFKLWLEGFSEAFPQGQGPNYQQWMKILDKLEMVESSFSGKETVYRKLLKEYNEDSESEQEDLPFKTRVIR